REPLAVQARHRDAGARVAPVLDADHVLRLAAHPVLRPEQARRPHPGGDQAIDGVHELRVDAGSMAEQPDASTAQEIELLAAENVEARQNHGQYFTSSAGPWEGPAPPATSSGRRSRPTLTRSAPTMWRAQRGFATRSEGGPGACERQRATPPSDQKI